jgi:hypothetical protein
MSDVLEAQIQKEANQNTKKKVHRFFPTFGSKQSSDQKSNSSIDYQTVKRVLSLKIEPMLEEDPLEQKAKVENINR